IEPTRTSLLEPLQLIIALDHEPMIERRTSSLIAANIPFPPLSCHWTAATWQSGFHSHIIADVAATSSAMSASWTHLLTWPSTVNVDR
ncbi:hypothetical protein Tco_1537630, partial [Tanacetum coccineum]